MANPSRPGVLRVGSAGYRFPAAIMLHSVSRLVIKRSWPALATSNRPRTCGSASPVPAPVPAPQKPTLAVTEAAG